MKPTFYCQFGIKRVTYFLIQFQTVFVCFYSTADRMGTAVTSNFAS